MKQLSQHAQVAKLCRQFLKANGLQGRASSSSFAGGNSVRVRLIDPTPAQIKQCTQAFAKYQYGHFDGMQDLYEISNHRDDIPQTKYLHIEVDYSDEMKQSAWTFLRDRFAGADALPEAYADLNHAHELQHEMATVLVYRLLRGSISMGNLAEAFWNTDNLAAA